MGLPTRKSRIFWGGSNAHFLAQMKIISNSKTHIAIGLSENTLMNALLQERSQHGVLWVRKRHFFDAIRAAPAEWVEKTFTHS